MYIQYISCTTIQEGADCHVEKISEDNSFILYRLSLKFKKETSPSTVTLRFFAPALDFFSQWSPLRDFERSLLPNWGRYLPENPSRLAFGAPLHCFISQSGQNRVCLSVSDVKTPLVIRSGMRENPGGGDYLIEFFSSKTTPISEYCAYIRFDIRDIPYHQAIADAVNWWDEINTLPPVYVPYDATMPMYSTWYNFHQEITDNVLIEECKEAYKYGMRTIIIDDGWQTEDGAGGYKFCGDWKLCRSKISDMSVFVERVHEIGMKVMLWYSVPFVGKGSELWDKFKGKYLDNPDNEWNRLDPRFPDVRDYLVNTYETALKEWNLDGFKLDFIDEFALTEFSDYSSPERDFNSLEDGIEALLSEISTRLKSINPDVLLEFRQSYVGPVVKAYGNMLRVGDCAYDMIKNRMGTIDLRLTSGKTAVHSDMIIWNNDDSNESIAKQLIAVFFAVPQISVKLTEICEEHKRVLHFFLDLWGTYRDILINGELIPHNPECLYSVVEARKDKTSFIVCYNDNVVDVLSPETVIINGTGKDYIILKTDADIEISYTILNCLGETTKNDVCRLTCGVHIIPLAQSDVLKLQILT